MKRIVSVILAVTFVCLAFSACSAKKKRYNYDLSDYIDLGEYMNIPAETAKTEVTDETVEDQIMATVNYYARKLEVTDRPVKSGDYVTVDYAGYVDGVSTDTVTVYNTEISVGLGSYPEEFENALIGMKTGEQKKLTIKLPDTFTEYPEYSGKSADIIVSVKKIAELDPPVYNDDFVRAYLGYDSVEEFEEAVRESLTEKQKIAFYGIVVPQVWDVVYENTEVKKYPDAEVKENYDALVGSVTEYVETLNLDMEAFIEKNFEMTEDEFFDNALEQAQMDVKERMICYSIARAERIKISEDEYTKRALEYAVDGYGFETLAELEAKYSREKIEELILCDVVKEFIADNASITYKNKD